MNRPVFVGLGQIHVDQFRAGTRHLAQSRHITGFGSFAKAGDGNAVHPAA